jgi:V/A-type H+-transporting ATPase subunit I
MKLLSIMGQYRQLGTALDVCVKSGCCHPEDTAALVSQSSGFTRVSDENPYFQPFTRLNDILSALGIKPRQLPDFTPTPETELKEYINTLEERVVTLSVERAQICRDLESTKLSIELLRHFLGLKIQLDKVFGGQFIKVRFGRLPAESFAKLRAYDDNPYLLFFPCSNDGSYYFGMYVTPKDRSEEIDRIFASLFFERLRIPDSSGTPEDAINERIQSRDKAAERMRLLDARLEELKSESQEKALAVYSQIKLQYDEFEARRFSARYHNSFLQILWVPERDTERLGKQLDQIDGIEFTFDNPRGQTPPVKLRNPRGFRVFEFYVGMFGLPNYREVDPTLFVAVTYTLFFGIMFADFGQGLLLSIAGFVMWKFKGMKVGKILVPCGICGALWGVVFGSCFGFEEVFDPLYGALGFEGKPIHVMDSVLSILMLSVGLGMAMLMVAMVINIYSCFKRRDFENAVFGANGAAGLCFYGSVVLYALGIFMNITLMPVGVFAVVAAVTLLLIFSREPLGCWLFKTPREKESAGDFVMKSFFELFETVLSYVTNTVSFMRVGAFVLVHAGMMMAFFALADMVGTGLAPVMIVLGNALVLALEGLLVGVQSLRLEYYELFSRFFTGDGRPFKPLSV